MTDAPTTGEVYQSTEEDILPINIFHKPLLPVFETTQNAPRSKGSPQKKVAEEDVNVKVTTDIRDVLKDDATRMAECTTKLIPFYALDVLLTVGESVSLTSHPAEL